MTIPKRLYDFLNDSGLSYQLVNHQHSNSSIGTAVTAELPYQQIAKAVILEDHDDKKIMAVLPTNRKISLSILGEKLKRKFHLMRETQIYKLFDECEHGAVPPFAELYNMDCIYDDSLLSNQAVYLEAGDHETLIKLDQDVFLKLMQGVKHDAFSHQFMH